MHYYHNLIIINIRRYHICNYWTNRTRRTYFYNNTNLNGSYSNINCHFNGTYWIDAFIGRNNINKLSDDNCYRFNRYTRIQMDTVLLSTLCNLINTLNYIRGCSGHDRMVVGFITTEVVSSNPAHGDVYSIQHYVIKLVSDLRQVGGFLWFPPPVKLAATYTYTTSSPHPLTPSPQFMQSMLPSL
jgi:hypothetical protein